MDQKPIEVKSGKITFDCPICDKQVDFQDAFTEEKLGKGLERVGLVCPFCQNMTISYYSNAKIRNTIAKLKDIRERKEANWFERHKALQAKHIKYFDKFQIMAGGSRIAK